MNGESKMTCNPNGFDLEKIRSSFTLALSNHDSIDLQHYLDGIGEIIRLFDLLGTVFGFVSSDLKTKSAILDAHRRDCPEAFQTVQSMVEYELRENLTTKKNSKGRDSGSRTFLRLHRALEFFCDLLHRLVGAKDDDPVSSMASESYGKTLGRYHPWVVRQVAYLAVKTLPTKIQLNIRYCKQEKEEAEALAPVTVSSMRAVYKVTQDLFAEKGLLNLP